MKHRISFEWHQLGQLAAFVAGLNMNGVPYSVEQDKHGIDVVWGDGF